MLDFSELTNWSEYTKLFIGLFALVSPPIILPLFMGVVGHMPDQEKKKTALVGALGFAVIMIVFTFLGTAILNLFGITIPAFRIAGGLLLLFIALDMMRSEVSEITTSEQQSTDSAISLGIVPLTMPILAGPGALSTLIILANLHQTLSHQIVVSIVILLLAVYVFLILRFSVVSGRMLGRNTMIVFYRVMGLIIAAIAVEFILDGLSGHFPILESVH